MKKTEKVYYQVICHNNPDHVIEKCFEIEEGTEEIDTKVEIYCSQCDDFVSFQIKGKIPKDQDVLRILKEHNL